MIDASVGCKNFTISEFIIPERLENAHMHLNYFSLVFKTGQLEKERIYHYVEKIPF